ncbi:TetR family transcriptional regulator [Amycolatopsis mediterranei S699]|uniref:TetR family transcriptional regulator n=2 Tax=Amycolatopsis mediterranei TaxID=33910 RepID=A0A0H3D8S8_AMYMU|nr:TetR/AcrR family transcriptional regulator [Amycolatopsis mediterranei]ADJ46478.1 TetR family transcriptional regulator [Amycolatopsis mediterranei U32]AEK43276.1 TetR family transcriptional regulator [Amycolatopsis mediterranei S699]AFO78189.1 TetR family transcriptional regulator [Amycolatopsis mediterranei S699]AGT85317.1 TetR family transcriptional regulator [Amycolatopsis mediterranei RB]KDO06429.1 TetR family transcriptional regulator [Amycolatopsis mediterranei]
MPKPSDTKQRILDVARELFTSQGVQRTSLQDIADRLGITKPALYYHFPSREDLVRSIVQPLLDDGEKFLLDQEARGDAPVRELIEGFFDFNHRHRADVVMLLAEMPTLADLGLIDRVLGWRTRLTELICGPAPTLEQQARAILALGGLQDVCMQFPDVPVADLKAAAVAGALDALGR